MEWNVPNSVEKAREKPPIITSAVSTILHTKPLTYRFILFTFCAHKATYYHVMLLHKKLLSLNFFHFFYTQTIYHHSPFLHANTHKGSYCHFDFSMLIHKKPVTVVASISLCYHTQSHLPSLHFLCVFNAAQTPIMSYRFSPCFITSLHVLYTLTITSLHAFPTEKSTYYHFAHVSHTNPLPITSLHVLYSQSHLLPFSFLFLFCTQSHQISFSVRICSHQIPFGTVYHGALCICGEFEWLNPKEKKSGRERGKKFLQTAMYRRPLKEGRHTDVSCSYGLCSEAKRSVGKNVGEKITWQYRAKQSFTNEKSPGACARTHAHTHTHRATSTPNPYGGSHFR